MMGVLLCRVYILVETRKQIWDVPASAKTGTGPEIVEETSCALLLLDLDDKNSLRVAKRWQAMITEGEAQLPTHGNANRQIPTSFSSSDQVCI